MTINICRTCDRKARDESLLSYRIEANSFECLLPSKVLMAKKKNLKKTGNWNDEAYAKWVHEYLKEIRSNKAARNVLNSILKTYQNNAANPEIVIVVSENEKWSWSLRRILTGLLMGAGVSASDIVTDLALTSEPAQVMTDIYRTYRSIAA